MVLRARYDAFTFVPFRFGGGVMDQIIQEIVRKYREYKARVKNVFGRPLPGALALVAILLFPPLAAPAAEATNPYYGDEFYSAL
jgi:hypothetical protein